MFSYGLVAAKLNGGKALPVDDVVQSQPRDVPDLCVWLEEQRNEVTWPQLSQR